MRLRYENTVDDLVALQEHWYEQTPAIRSLFIACKWIGAALIVGITCFLAEELRGTNGGYGLIVLFGIGMAAGFVWIYPLLLKYLIGQVSRMVYAAGANKTVLCWHELELQDDGLAERTQYSESKYAWNAIMSIGSAPGYTFIYVGSMTAHVIPHARVSEGDLSRFLTDLAGRLTEEATSRVEGAATDSS